MKLIKKSMPEYEFINSITYLFEIQQPEIALAIIRRTFKDLSTFEKKLLTLNIIEATKEYDILNCRLPESYFDFLASAESNDIFGFVN